MMMVLLSVSLMMRVGEGTTDAIFYPPPIEKCSENSEPVSLSLNPRPKLHRDKNPNILYNCQGLSLHVWSTAQKEQEEGRG
ncbi:hypothetical protein CEXT_594371 [Caerostris extrusa]|uniref:Secreted protein n=1 Tax=Caerostris extrusa TaxID=172846 RepID=A0AAV4UXG8_CAEEX|nr:hypothetical protein CEXT_594371 [Caerostris extrusa]